jgi:hypothetical protein
MIELDTKSQQFIDGIALRLGCEFEADAEAIQISKRTLPEICRLSNEAEGLDASGSNFEQVRDAFGFGSLFSSALSNALSKTVLDLYDGIQTSWQKVFNRAEVSRLNSERVTLEPLASPPQIADGGDYPGGQIEGDVYSWRLGKYGRIFTVSFEAILSDDIDLIQRLLNEHISACKRLEDDLAFGLLLANPLMSDNSVYFCTGHSNLLTTNGFSEGNLGKSLAQLRAQKSKSGVALRLNPTFLIIPGELEDTVRKAITNFYGAGDADKLEIVVESRLSGLSGGSTTTWYLGCDPKQIDSFVVGFLEGQTEPQALPLRKNLKVDGQQYLIRHVVGCKGVFERSMVKNTA